MRYPALVIVGVLLLRPSAARAQECWQIEHDYENAKAEYAAYSSPSMIKHRHDSEQQLARLQKPLDECRRKAATDAAAAKAKEQERMRVDAAARATKAAVKARLDAEANAMEDKHEAELDLLRSNPAVGRLIWSTELCIAQKARTTTLAAIAKERKYSRIGGVVSLKDMKDLQDDLRASDDRIAAAKATLRAEPATSPLACSAPKVVALWNCYQQLENGNLSPVGICADSVMENIVELLTHEFEHSGPGQ